MYKKYRMFTSRLMVACLLYPLSFPSLSVTLNYTYFHEEAHVFTIHQTGSDTTLAESLNVSRGESFASASINSTYPVSTVSSIRGTQFGAATAATTTQYQYSITPLSSGLPTSVPIVFSASGSITVDQYLGWGNTQAYVNYDRGNDGLRQWNLRCDSFDCSGGTFSFDNQDVFNVDVNTAYDVELVTSTHGQADPFNPSPDYYYSGYAFIDPEITIDPTFAFADQFIVNHSPGVSFVPIPASLPLMASALGLLGFFTKRRNS